MEPTRPVSGQPSLPPTRGESGSQSWQVGQILKAIAVSSGRQGNPVQLHIGQQLVQSQTPVPLQAGQSLQLQVQSLTPLPVLRIVNTATPQPVADAVRAALPKQGAIAPLLSNLVQLVSARQPVLPPLLQELGRQIVQQLPTPQTASTGEGLKQAMQQSGLFLESRLVNNTSATRVDFNTDFKANLLKLVQLVRNWPGAPTTPPAGQRATSAQYAPATAGLQNPTAPPTGQPTATQPATTATSPAALPPGAGIPSSAATATGTAAASTGKPASQAIPPGPQGTQPAAVPADKVTPQQAARGLQATTPLPATTPPSSSGVVPPLAGGVTTPSAAPPTAILVAPPAPPLRGHPPLPQPAAQASLHALDAATKVRAELQVQVDAAVARMHLNQLASLPQDKDSGLEWLFDLPIRRGEETDTWSMQISRDGGQDGKQQPAQTPTWTVQLAFDLPGLGPMQARVVLRNEQISTWFWATEAHTVPFLEKFLPDLRKGLESAGLEVAELSCQQGAMPGPPTQPASGGSFLDERA